LVVNILWDPCITLAKGCCLILFFHKAQSSTLSLFLIGTLNGIFTGRLFGRLVGIFVFCGGNFFTIFIGRILIVVDWLIGNEFSSLSSTLLLFKLL